MLISDEVIRELNDIEFRDRYLILKFSDGGEATAPYWWYPNLQNATIIQRQNWQLSGNGRGIHWPDIDEDLNINSILSGQMAPNAERTVEAAK